MSMWSTPRRSALRRTDGPIASTAQFVVPSGVWPNLVQITTSSERPRRAAPLFSSLWPSAEPGAVSIKVTPASSAACTIRIASPSSGPSGHCADHDEEAEMVAPRAFGDTGIAVSEIGLGTWQLGRSAQWPDGPDEGEAIRIVHAALDAGVTFIDTAPGYADGQSELNIGAALRGRSDEVVICTK